ncbi:MAG: hypothetical protein CM1200mP26_07110 [Acidimicrobiales bacterium]|nr:MAG: hypothetical protein CM1200mP26_07110 [Acidimicrobiales bacterium]
MRIPGPMELVIDNELGYGISIAPPRTGPVWGNESTGGQVALSGCGWVPARGVSPGVSGRRREEE